MRRFEGVNTAKEVVKNLEINKDSAIDNVTNIPCPRCSKKGMDGKLVVKKGRYGEFYGCTNFPKCRYTESLSKRKKYQR